MRTFLPADSYIIAGRGRVFTGTQPDPPFGRDAFDTEVEIEGSAYRIKGIEHFLAMDDWPPKPGQAVGLLVEPL